MDSRILTACRLLLEVASEQLAVDSGQLTVDDEPESNKQFQMTYGDNPNFDPARCAELRRGEEGAVIHPNVIRPAAGTIAPGPEPNPMRGSGQRENQPPAYGSDHPVSVFRETALPPLQGGELDPNSPLSILHSPLSTPAPEPSATLTMRDISDHFERDARRY